MTGSSPLIGHHRRKWRGFEPALFVLLLFLLWSVAVRIDLSNGSRHDAFATRTFGDWPASFGALGGSGDLEFSIYVTFGQNEILGSPIPGTETDSGDAGSINGSRFVSGDAGGEVHSLSVYVPGPVEESPRNRFQGAIYTDLRGAPDKLLASSAVAELTPSGWNSVPINGALRAKTPYWLMYNTNGATAAGNNVAYNSVSSAPLDRIIRIPKAAWLRRLAGVFVALANPGPAALIVICLVIWQIWLHHRRRGLILLVAFGLALILEAALKHSIFYPYESYPSGHAIRAIFLVACVSQLSRRRSFVLGARCAAIVVCLAVIYTEGHYSEEVVGGALAGWGIAIAAMATIDWIEEPRPKTARP